MADLSTTAKTFNNNSAKKLALAAALLVLFLGIHCGLRLAVSSSLNSDEAELVLFNQSLEWGYGFQPPLYSWLVWGVAQTFGISLLTLTLIRTAILFGTTVFLFLSARAVFRDSSVAVLAAFSLLFVPMMVWHALTYLTHSTLMCLFLAATFYVLVRIVQLGRWYDYLALGVVAGLGVLSKYNFAIFLAAIGFSGLTVGQVRRRMLTPWMLVSIVLAIGIVLPHVHWTRTHWEDLQAVLQLKLSAKVPGRQFFGMPRGVVDTAVNMVLLGGFMALVVAGLFRNNLRQSKAEGYDFPTYKNWLERFYVCILLIHVGLAFFKNAGLMHERWLEPYYILLPIYLFSFLKMRAVPSMTWRRYAGALAFVALALTIARCGQVWAGGSNRGFNPIDGSFTQIV